MNEELAKRAQVNNILSLLNEELDIPDTKYDDAEASYKSVGKWMGRPESSIRRYFPELYVQGSFRLGTVIRPFNEDCEYDIDSVCKLELSTVDCSQQELKQLIGFETKEYAKTQGIKKPVKEGRRCWTLRYDNEARFHMDILPAIPNAETFRLLLEKNGIKSPWADDAIGITDNTLSNYKERNAIWSVSNPKGYANWFRAQMKVASSTIYGRTATLMEKYASVEDVPTYKLKTTLQRVVQILKHHRDIVYGNDGDKPISVIISTLAAHAYNNEDDIVSALLNIAPNILKYIENREGVPWVKNPSNPLENFADKWTDHPKRKKKFYEWHNAVIECLQNYIEFPAGLPVLNEGIIKLAGKDVARRVMTRYGNSVREIRDRGELKATKISATLGTIGSTIKNHNFYGQ